MTRMKKYANSLTKSLYTILVSAATIHVAQATTDVSELREYFNLAFQVYGTIPGCPDYDSIPTRVLEQGVECLQVELQRLESVESPVNKYPGPCTTACGEFYAYFGAECLRADNEATESYGQDLKETLAYGSVPVGIDRAFILSLGNLGLEEEEELSKSDWDYVLDNRNSVALDTLDYVADAWTEGSDFVESLIETCDVQRQNSAISNTVSTSNASHMRMASFVTLILLAAVLANT